MDTSKAVFTNDAVVLGISPDNPGSHLKFIDKYDLNFTLLCDESKRVMEKYGAWGEKMMYGKKVIGVIRSTVWIGPDGKVAKLWKRVKVDGHDDQVLAAVKELLDGASS